MFPPSFYAIIISFILPIIAKYTKICYNFIEIKKLWINIQTKLRRIEYEKETYRYASGNCKRN